MSTLTVVIPAFNAETHIAQAIRSASDAGATQILVIDDGSTDGTAAAATAAGATVHTQENAGASRARTRGAALAQSDYVIFLDADDLLIPAGVRESVAILDDDESLAVAAGVVIGFSRSSSAEERFPIRYSPVTTQSLLQEGFGPWPPCNAVVRVSSLRRAEEIDPSPLHLRYADDYELLIRLSRAGNIHVRDEPTCKYSMDGGKSARGAQAAIEAKEQVREHYSRAYDIPIVTLTDRQIKQSAIARQMRAARAAGRRIEFLRAGFSWLAADPLAASKRIANRRPRASALSGSKEAPVDVWASGQLDNIGDSLLRRPYLERLRGQGPLHIWVRQAKAPFLSGMGVVKADETYAEFSRWYFGAIKRRFRGRAHLALNAGEVPVSRSGAMRLTALSLLALLTRARGGRVYWLGAGVPPTRSILRLPYSLAATLSTDRWVRDDLTLATLKRSPVVPDWAFSLGTAVESWPSRDDRDLLTIVLRGDRALPPDWWIAWLKEQCRLLQLTPVAVIQVARDEGSARMLAEKLPMDVVRFDDPDHATQEERARSHYRRSLITVGDRLHGLIVAATEGSLPVGWIPTSRGKIKRHFDAAGMKWVGEHEGVTSDTALPHVAELLATADLGRCVQQARDQLDANVQRVFGARNL